MGRSRILVALELCMAAFAIGVAVVMVGPASIAAAYEPEALATAIAVGVSLLLLGVFNVWLPRGDAVDTTVPMAFAAAMLLNPIVAIVVMILARCATIALNPKGQTLDSALEQVARRCVLVLAAYALMGGVAPRVLGGALDLTPTEIIWLVAAAISFVAFDVLLEQVGTSVRSRTPLFPLVLGAARLQGSMVSAEMSTAILAVMLFPIPSIRYWGLVIPAALLLVMRQSFALLLEVRASYTSTVEVLARSLEAYDPGRRGHAERVARMVGAGGRLIGFQGRALEHMTYAALFHDVGSLGVDEDDQASEVQSAQVLSGVGFLAGAMPILRVLDSSGDVETSPDEKDLIGAYLIASFSAVDDEITGIERNGRAIANAIGARLYAATRRSVDRVVHRIELDARRDSQLEESNRRVSN